MKFFSILLLCLAVLAAPALILRPTAPRHHHRRPISPSKKSKIRNSAPTPSRSPTPSPPPDEGRQDPNPASGWSPSAGGEEIPLTAEGVVLLPSPLEPRRQIHRLPLRPQRRQDPALAPQSLRRRSPAPHQHPARRRGFRLVARRPAPLCRPPRRHRRRARSRPRPRGRGQAVGGEDAPPTNTSAKKTKAQKPWVIDRLQFKVDEVGYLDHHRNHLYVFDLAAKSLTQITGGDYDDAQPAWSPDGTKVAFASNRSADPDRNYDNNIWTVAADNTDKGAHLTQVTTNPGEDHDPAWSPDGKWIAYVTQTEPKLFEYATKHLGISPAEGGGQANVVTRAFDRGVSDIRFSGDSQVRLLHRRRRRHAKSCPHSGRRRRSHPARSAVA